MKMGKSRNKSIGVIGAGSWGTALAGLLSGKGLDTYLWGHRREHVENLQRERENKKYLPGFLIPETLNIHADLNVVVNRCPVLLMVLPSQQYRAVFRDVLSAITEPKVIVSAVKGIENESLYTMTEVMEDEIQKSSLSHHLDLAVLSGPSFAREVADSVPTAVTVGCKKTEIAEELQYLFGTDSFRVYTSRDVIGLELSAAFKNIIALATGICDGLGYGMNTRAALITRGLAEITRLGIKCGADPLTFAGLSGMGDLILTCTGDLSRNRTVGLALGQGKKLDEILKGMDMVAEGVKTTLSGYKLAQKHCVDMPILEQVYAILYQDKDCSTAVRELLQRELKPE
jgi:glycerol-3-phosphate dehydrogenase (NAD(P)+)